MDPISSILESPKKLIVFSLDKQYRYLYFNKNHFDTMKSIWGVEIEMGKSMLDYILSEKDRKKAKKNFDKALKGLDFSVIEEYGDKKLNRFYYEDIYTPLYDEKGEVNGLTVFVNDITERRSQEVELLEAEERFRAIIEGAFEGILVARISDKSLTYINPSGEKMFGYSSEDIGKMKVKDFHPESELLRIQEKFFSQPIKDPIFEYNVKCKRKNGEEFYANISAADVVLNGEKCLVGYFTDITKEKESLEKIKIQEDILDAVGQSIIVMDTDGIIRHWNKHAETMYGWTKEEVLGKAKDDFLPADMSEEELKKVYKELYAGNHWTAEVKAKDKGNKEIPILLTSSPIFNERGELSAIISISVDISDRIKSEKEIQDNEKLYKSIISSLSEGLVVQDKTDKVIVANDSAADILGMTMGQLIGKDSADPRWKALKEDGTPYKPEEHPSMLTLNCGIAMDNQIMNVHTGNGQRKIISINTRPIRDDEGEVSGVVASFTDISESRRAQNILKESESRLKNISDSVPGAVLRYKLNEDGTDELLFISQGAESLWEIKKDIALKDVNKLWKIVHDEDLAGLQQSVKYSAENLSAWNHEWRIVFPDGRIKWLNGRGMPVKSKDGSVIWDNLILDVTEQKETLIKLDESQKLVESINQNINEAIYRANPDGVVYVNQAFFKMFGYKDMEDLKLVDPVVIYKNPKDRKKLLIKLETDGSFENEELTFVRKDGSEFIGLISSRLYKDFEGKKYWDGAIRDVTSERQATKRIEQSQQLLESINKNINEALYRSINRKGLVYVNEEFVKMFGYNSVEEILEADPTNLYKNAEDRRLLGDELIEKGSYVNREVEFQRKDGSTFWGSISSIMLKGENEEIYFDGAIRDISLQKDAEFSLRRQADSQKLLRNISSNFINLPLDKINDAIQRSLESLCKFANADRAFVFDVYQDENYCVNTYEWVRTGVESRIDLMQFVPLYEMPEMIDPFLEGRNVNIKNVQNLEDSFFKKILLEQNIKSTIGVPILNGKKCIGFVGFDAVKERKEFSKDEISLLSIFSDMMLNIKNRVENQVEMKQLLNTTTDQNKRLKDFSFMTSHNIRSSVSNVLGLTKLILEEPENRAYLELLNKAAEKLDTTIKNINQLLHFESSFQTKELTECNLREVINRILELNRKIIRDKEIQIAMEIPEDLNLITIPAFLDSIFYNLLSNAFKYGITRNSKTIRIWHESNKNEDRIYIQDWGWGIDLDKHKEKLFKLGSRLHFSSEGQGLGLYMTKHQIEELGGKIEIESEVDKGTIFKLKFPRNVVKAVTTQKTG